MLTGQRINNTHSFCMKAQTLLVPGDLDYGCKGLEKMEEMASKAEKLFIGMRFHLEQKALKLYCSFITWSIPKENSLTYVVYELYHNKSNYIAIKLTYP